MRFVNKNKHDVQLFIVKSTHSKPDNRKSFIRFQVKLKFDVSEEKQGQEGVRTCAAKTDAGQEQGQG